MKKRMRLLLLTIFTGVLFASSLTVFAEDKNSFNVEMETEYVSDTCRVEGITTTIAGSYVTRKTRGLVVISSRDELRQTFNVPKYCGKDFWINFYDADTKSPQAVAVLSKAAADLGWEIGPAFTVELGVTSYDKDFTLLPSNVGPARMLVGIPHGFFDRSKTYALISVREGGATTVHPDLDTNPWSVTFDTTGGAATYAIVRY